jgi:transposase
MHVETHLSQEDLERRIQNAKQPKLRQRLRIVYWARCGETAEQIVPRVGLSRRRVQEWVARYNAHGLEGLKDLPGRGRKLPLAPQQVEQLKERLDEGPPKSDVVCVFTGPLIQQWIEQTFNKSLTLSATYYLLHAIGYSWLVPRPRHPQADPQKQEAFKKGTPRKAR